MSIFQDSSGRLRTFWRFALFGIGMAAVQIAIGLFAFAGLLIYLAMIGDFPNLNRPAQVEQFTQGYLLPLTVIAAVPTGVLPFAWMAFCRRYLDRRPLSSSGFIRPSRGWWNASAAGFAVGLLPIAVGGGIIALAGGLNWSGWGATAMTWLMIPTFLLLAFHEEVVFRGYLYQNLLDIHRPRFGLVFSSTVFWLVHSLNPAAWSSPIVSVNLFGAGIVLALAYRAAGNIWFPTAVHFGWNFAQGMLFGVPVSGIHFKGFINWQVDPAAPIWLTGGDFGFEGSVVITAIEVLLVAGFFIFMRRRPDSATGTQGIPADRLILP